MQQPAGGHIEKTRNQVHQRAFSRAARSNYRQNFSRLHFQINAAQDLARLRCHCSVVGKADIFKANDFAKTSAVASRPGFSCTSSSVSMNSKISDDAPSACWKLLLKQRKFAHRIVELEYRNNERDEHSQVTLPW